MDNDKEIIKALQPKPIDPYGGIDMLVEDNKRMMSMDKPKDIPQGEFCTNCPHKGYITTHIVNAMGDNVGYQERPYCEWYKTELYNGANILDFISGVEQVRYGCQKCFACMIKSNQKGE